MPKLTIEYADITGDDNPAGYFVRVFIDGQALGVTQRLEVRQTSSDPFPTVEIDQVIYTREQLALVKKLQSVPGLKYTPTFLNHQGEVVSEKEAWFAEDHPEGTPPPLTGSWTKFVDPPKEE